MCSKQQDTDDYRECIRCI